jgi:hypothetical protein
MKPNRPVPSAANSMKPGSTRSIASRSHPLISTIRHWPANRLVLFAMGIRIAITRWAHSLGTGGLAEASPDGPQVSQKLIEKSLLVQRNVVLSMEIAQS